MDFDGPDVAAIESALDAQRPGGWCRLGEKALAQYLGIGPRAGWWVDVPRGQVALPGIDHLLLLIDSAFPWSEPRVIAPQATADFTWPHVERGGLLCLKRTRYDAGAADRALACLSYACELLNYGERKRRKEFAREFSAYWNQKLPEKRPGLRIPAMLTDESDDVDRVVSCGAWSSEFSAVGHHRCQFSGLESGCTTAGQPGRPASA